MYVTISFILGMFGIFFVIKEVFYDFSDESNLTHMACSYVLWSAQYGGVILILLRVCEQARRSAFETPLIVHKIVQRKPLFIEHNDIYYNKMKSFTLHSLHRKKTFQFSGQGLFIFDYTFIFSVSGISKFHFICQMLIIRIIDFHCVFYFVAFKMQVMSAGFSYLIVLLQFDMSIDRMK